MIVVSSDHDSARSRAHVELESPEMTRSQRLLVPVLLLLTSPWTGCGESPPPSDESSQVIGPEGGTISSSDGRLQIEIPEGALAAPTELTVKVRTNEATRGLGQGYRVTPETALLKKARVMFLFDTTLLSGASPPGLGIAFRQGSGAWMAITATTLDASAGRISVETDHFSDWALFEQLYLEPQSAQVEVTQALQLRVMRCVQESDPETFITPLVPECEPLSSAGRLGDWAVNGASGGSAEVGTVASQGTSATYSAPANLPTANPVAVSVEAGLPGKAQGMLVSNVTVTSDCPVAFCRLVGTSENTDRVGDFEGDYLYVKATATNVTWEYVRTDFPEAVYRPTEGTVTFDWSHDDCSSITLSPSSVAIQPMDGELRIDFSQSPPTFSGSASSSVDGSQIWDCPPGQPFDTEAGASGAWFEGRGMLVDGRSVQGSLMEPNRWGTWSFSVP